MLTLNYLPITFQSLVGYHDVGVDIVTRDRARQGKNLGGPLVSG